MEPFLVRITAASPLTHRLIKPTQEDLESSGSPAPTPTRATYRLKKLIIADVVPVLVLFVLPTFAHAGMFTALAGIFNTEEPKAQLVKESAENLPLLRAATNIDPNPAKGGGDILVDDFALVPDSGPFGGSDSSKVSEQTGEISVYVVREGDSLSKIAQMFHVTTNTILWANDISNPSTIQPGDSLIILPITGVRHIVKSGDTIASIVKKYSGDEEDILAYNQLSKGVTLTPGMTVVIPGGEMHTTAPVKVASKSAAGGGGKTSNTSVARGYFTHPVPGAVRTQGIHGYNGVDLGAPAGTPVRAAAAGQVIVSKPAGYNGGYGQYIVVKHANGTQTLYAHLSSNLVGVGTQVAQGQVIGKVGNTGRSTGNHLHFEVRGAANPF